MDHGKPLKSFPVRLSTEQVKWLDSLITGPIVTRSEALRHVVADAMKRDSHRRNALARKILQGDA
jgi:hypothetical protein